MPTCGVALILRHCGVLLCTPHSSGLRKPCSWTFSTSLPGAGFSTVSWIEYFLTLKWPSVKINLGDVVEFVDLLRHCIFPSTSWRRQKHSDQQLMKGVIQQIQQRPLLSESDGGQGWPSKMSVSVRACPVEFRTEGLFNWGGSAANF